VRIPWIGAAIVLAALTALGIQTGIVARTGFLMGDFRAFYCAARVASQGGNPYHVEPLRSCEFALGSKEFFKKNPGVTIPAPLPGYALAALVPLAMLPFGIAAGLWSVLLVAAWIACIYALVRFAGAPWDVAFAVLALSLGVLSLPFGEVVPLSLAFICMAAYCAWRGKYRAAGALAAGALVEPHLGLPACVALAVWVPAARVPLALIGGVLAALSLAFLGLAGNVEYFASVLPAHALSEISRDTQYSLTAAMSAIGASPATALRAGSLWYVAMIVAGTFVAGRLARKTRNDAFIVCVPVAFAVFGGTFIHVTQIAAALPAAVLLVAYAPREYRTPAVVALLLLAVPWGWTVSPSLLVAPVLPIGYVAWRYSNGSLSTALLSAIAAGAFLFGASALAAIAPHLSLHAHAPAIDPRLAEASWSAFTQGSSTGSLISWLTRLPTWIGLALLLYLLVRYAGVAVRFRQVVPVALAAVCTLSAVAGQVYGDRTGGWLMVDFRAYYCASLAQREHRNPYFSESIQSCERSAPAPYYRAPPNVTVPAPYPPYVLALLYPFTFLPFGAAAIAWWSLLVLALGAAAYALARIAKQPLLVGWAAFAFSLGLVSMSSGNLAPLAIAAVVVAALGVARKRFSLAVAAIALAMIEPQVALPAAIAFFVAYPAIRLALCAAAGALVALSLVAAGFAQTIAYVTTVLPAHALSEVSRDNQYSVSTVLAALGVPDASAALIGSITYALMLAVGVAVALRLARRYDEPALTLLVPPAFAVFGGSFVHTAELAAAVPAALLLFTRAQEYRAWLFAALILLVVPWMMATSAALFLAPLFPVAYLTYALWPKDRGFVMGTAVAAFAAILGLFLIAQVPVHAIAHAHSYPFIDPRLAEASWRQFVLGNVTNRPAMWFLRLPSWAGLIALAVPALLLASKPRLMLAVESA
jgi:hypothetical protein